MIDWNLYLKYYPRKGVLVWRDRDPESFLSRNMPARWKTLFVGKVAGYEFRARGVPRAVVVRLNGQLYLAHRIIWEMVNGPIPDGMLVDHKDGNPWNNKLDNIRLATPAQNAMNRKTRRDSKVGIKGIYVKCGAWYSRIQVGSDRFIEGPFDTPEIAHASYCKMAKKHFGEFARFS